MTGSDAVKIPAVMVGQAIGDALGMPFETLDETVHPDLAAWDGAFRAGTFHQLPPGHYTDDTEMAMCLAKTLLACGEYNGDYAAGLYRNWSTGTPHGMGGTTRKAMLRLCEGIGWTSSGVTFDNPNEVGSAPAMRAAPLGTRAITMGVLHGWCALDAAITHRNPEAEASSLLVAATVMHLLHEEAWGYDARVPVRRKIANQHIIDALVSDLGGIRHADGTRTRVYYDMRRAREMIAYPATFLPDHVNEEFTRRGNARSVSVTALYFALTAENFRDGVVAAIKFGGDADTRGAIAGAMLGARFGLDGIPVEYRNGVLDFESLYHMDCGLTAK